MPVTIVGNNTPTAGGVVYGDGTNYASTSAGSAGQVLLSNGASAPSFGAVGVAGGGTGQSSLTANNVLLGNGTSGVQFVAPGTNGNVLTSNGTTWVSAVAGGGITLLQTTTANNSSTVDLETGIGSTYSTYLITWQELTCPSIVAIRVKLSGSYVTSSTYNSGGAASYSNGAGVNAFRNDSSNMMNVTVTNTTSGSGAGCSGQMFFSNPTSTTLYKQINWVSVGQSGSQSTYGTGGGSNVSSTSALQGIRFLPTFFSDTLTTGTFRLYGITN